MRSCISLPQDTLRPNIPYRNRRSCRSPCSEPIPMDFSSCFQISGLPIGGDFLSQGQPGYSGLASKEGENEMLFQDPAQVQQWAATSATLPLASEVDVSEDMSRDSSQWSSFQASEVQDNNVMFPYDQIPLRTTTPGSMSASTGAGPTGIFTTSESLENLGLDANVYDVWSKSNPSLESLDKTPFRSAEASQKVFGSGDIWIDQQFPIQEDLNSCPGLYSTGQSSWSSPSTVSAETSLASSYTQPSIFHGYLSPTCLSGQEDLSSTASMDEPILSPLALGPAQSLFGADAAQTCDASRFVSRSINPSDLTIDSTLGQCNQYARPSLPYWGSSDNVHGTMVPAPEVFGMYRRPSSDGENTARRNELYQVGPKEDGLYHCPFAKDGCTHKPEKLKCNYDKHLDAHLKPYRCKHPDCADVPFSSTACLLRHEREAHGMHGHGDKPYLCTYEECDRSVPGNGFPRRWNLQDHMKRVHDYTGPPTSGDKTSASENVNSRSKKKRVSASSATAKKSKTGAIVKTTSKAAMPPKQRQSIQKNIKDEVIAAQDLVDPNDLQGGDFSAYLSHSNLPLPTMF